MGGFQRIVGIRITILDYIGLHNNLMCDDTIIAVINESDDMP